MKILRKTIVKSEKVTFFNKIFNKYKIIIIINEIGYYAMNFRNNFVDSRETMNNKILFLSSIVTTPQYDLIAFYIDYAYVAV